MIPKQNTFCLVMIVRNESKVIERCLSSVKDLIDYWVICDTGSIDGTQDVIRNFTKKHNMKGKLYEHEWKNFGYNRSLACKLAKGQCDYLITLDADEVFKFDEGFVMPKLTLDGYMVWTKTPAVEYQRQQIVSDKYLWYYEGVLHEYIDTKDKCEKRWGVIEGMQNNPHPDGARSSDKNKYRKDALVFEQALLDDPDNSRYVFYLAQSYRDCNDYENAIKNYRKRTKMVGFIEETFYAYYEIALCKMRRQDAFEEFVGDMLLAYNYRPSRLEPIHKLIRYCRMNNMSKMAYDMFKFVLEKPLETSDGLFVEKAIYDYKILDELSISAYWGEYYEDAIKILERIMEEKKYPKDEESRFLNHINICKQKLEEKKKVINVEKKNINWDVIDNNNLTNVFTTIYDTNQWGNQLQKHILTSGIGAMEETTMEYRRLLELYIGKNNIRSVVDIGCGLWEFEHNEFNNIMYIGIDCVSKVIDFNKEKYKSKNRLFICADILEDKNNIPVVDMCIVKDVLQHLSNENIIKLVKKLQAKSKFVLLIQDFDDNMQNDISMDIKNGSYRPLYYQKEPLKQFNPIRIATYWVKEILLIGKETFNNITVDDKKIIESVEEEVGNKIIEEEVDNKEVDNKIVEKVNNKVVVEDVDNKIVEVEKKVDKNIEMSVERRVDKTVLVSILARNKAHVLPKFLRCLDELDYDKKLMTIYINTNNNSDDTIEILENWMKENVDKYNKIDYENVEIEELEGTTTDPHEWTSLRFKKLAEIRNKSLKKTIEHNCDYYFVIDCDNFIEPYTLRDMVDEDKEIIAPMLIAFPEKNDGYSNYFSDISPNGYYKHHDNYMKILGREMVGVFDVPVVHCTYLIKREVIDRLNYMDGTESHEFVIFSRNARKEGIKQWISNKRYYGKLVHFFDDTLKLEDEKRRLENEL